MTPRIALTLLMAVATPVFGQPGFEDLRKGNRVRLKLLAGPCDAVITSRVQDRLSARLLADTPAGGKRGAIVSVRNSKITRINKHGRSRLEQSLELAAITGSLIGGAAIALSAEKGPAAGAGFGLMIGGPAALIVIGHQRRIHFDVIADRLEP